MTLLESILRFVPYDEAEAAHRDFVAAFVRAHERPFSRDHADAHLTGSAVVVSSDGQRVLLGYHVKLQRWLQLGGHGEPDDSCAEDVALREAHEESGIEGIALSATAPRPFDIDVHEIPSRGTVAAHKHLDLRYLMVAPPGGIPVRRIEEHESVRWFLWQEALDLPLDPALQRALRRSCILVAPTA